MPKIILRQTPSSQVLHTYPYDSFNTGQDISYATGDDKDIRDTVFSPEIASWDTALNWVTPKLDPTDPTRLLRGSNPDGSGTNIFGNLERFTDELGNRWTENLTDYIIDHLTGQAMYTDRGIIPNNNFNDSITYANNATFNSKTDWHTPNMKELRYSSLYDGYRRLLTNNINSGLYCSTTNMFNINSSYILQNINDLRNNALNDVGKNTSSGQILFRKAFTYNPTTKQMELS